MSEKTDDLDVRFKAVETNLQHLLDESKTNNRIIIFALAVMAAGKEILQVFKL
jgi:hypothetical protein